MVKKAKEIKEEQVVDTKKIIKELDKHLEAKQEEITNNIVSKIDEQIEFKVNKRMKEEEKKIVRGKNSKILRRDIVILALLALTTYFAYCLYKVDYFHIRTNIIYKPVEENKENSENNKNNENKPNEEKEEYDKDYYIKEYGYLIDNFKIEDEAVFELYNTKNITKEKLSNELKLKIAYKNLEEENKNIEDNMISFKPVDLLETARHIFGSDITLKDEMFSYNNTRFMFYNDTYLGFSEKDSKINLLSKIDNAKVNKDKLIFDVVVAKLTDNNELINNKNKVIIKDYQDEDILEYKDKLSTHRFTFLIVNDNYVFESIKAL